MLDENIANSVSNIFKEYDFECEYIRDLLPVGSVDPLVAFIAEVQDAILVSHDGDFQKISPRVPDGQKTRFRNLSRIHLHCKEYQAADRIRKAISFIKFEYEIAKSSRDQRMQLIIGQSYLKSSR